MDDNFIISLMCIDDKKINHARTNKNWINKHLDIKNYLYTRFSDTAEDTSAGEIVYRILHKIEIHPVCKICGKPVVYDKTQGYPIYCCKKCRYSDKDILEKQRNTCIKKYGVSSYSKSKEYVNKCKNTCLERYGVSSYTKTKDCKDKIAKTNLDKYGNICSLHGSEIEEEVKKTNLEKYGAENVFASDEIKEKIKQTNKERYGVENPMQNKNIKLKSVLTMLDRYGVEVLTQIPEISKIIQEKRFETQKLHNTFNTSSPEEKCYILLSNIFDNIIRQYKSEKYPYRCDFYIPDLDLYIEYQGNWTHGNHPFNENNIDDLNTINKWKLKNTRYYNSAINTWTKRDPEKRKIAKINNLNYIEFWNIREVEAFVISISDK